MSETPPADRQYVAVKYKTEDARSYTFHNDGDPVGAGQQVKLPDRSGNGWVRGTVVEAFVDKPKFPTKPILGLVDDQPAQPDMLG